MNSTLATWFFVATILDGYCSVLFHFNSILCKGCSAFQSAIPQSEDRDAVL
jgi:hypothetical protein